MKEASFRAPLRMAVQIGATVPDPGYPGVIIWSTTESLLLGWTGAAWQPVSKGSDIQGSFDFLQKTDGAVPEYSSSTGSWTSTRAPSKLILDGGNF